MNEFIKQLKDARRRTHFDPERKAAVRSYLARMTEAHTAVMARAENRRAPFRIQNIFARRAKPIFASVLALVVLSGGTSFAAQNALPGDILYPVKVSVNEPVIGALQVSSEAKADYGVELAIRRLDEASTLAQRGPVDNETKTKLAENFVARTSEVKQTLEKLKREKPERALAIADKFSKELDDRAAAFGDENENENEVAAAAAAGTAPVLLAAPQPAGTIGSTSEEQNGEGENNEQENEDTEDASPEPAAAQTFIGAASSEATSSAKHPRLVPPKKDSDQRLEPPVASTTPRVELRAATKQDDENGSSKRHDTLSGAVRNAGRDFRAIRQEMRDTRAENEER